MKTKIIAIMLSVLLMLQGVALADFQMGTESDILTVSGNVSEYENVVVMLLDSDNLGTSDENDTVSVYNALVSGGTKVGKNEIYYFANVQADENGVWTYDVPMPSGEYTKRLTLITSAGDTEFINYASIAYRLNMLPNIKAAALVSDEYESLKKSLSGYIDFICDNSKLYKELSDKKQVAILTSDTIKTLENDSASLTSLKNVVNEAVIIQSVNEGILTSFETAVSVYDYDSVTAAGITTEGKTKVLEALKGGEYKTETSYVEAMKKQIALQAINYNTNQSADNLHSVFLKQNEVLELDLKDFYKLSTAKQINVVKKFAIQKNESLSQLQIKLDALVASQKTSGVSSGGVGGGGSGSSNASTGLGNKNPGSTGVGGIVDEYLQEQKYIYDDLRDASWASDAVLFLTKKGIVNGYDDGNFKPLNFVTRAEFTKLVVCAFITRKLDSGEKVFEDVSSDEWYAPYINTAYSEGFVSGGGDSRFNPNDKITRQDMAVIIYNAAKKYDLIKNSDENIKFSDDSGISDYAKTAVYALREEKIINGVGDNMFEPLTYANRASAAQIIYSLIKNLTE